MKTNTPTCLVLGSMPMDIIQRKNADRTVDRLYVHVGHTAGNIATMLAAEFGWRTLPVAHFDGFGWGGRLKEDLGRYGADVRFVTTGGDRGTTFFVETHKTGRDGRPAVGRETRVPRGGRFSSYRLLTKDTARALLDGPLAAPPPPDVLFFTEPVAGHRLVAEGLREAQQTASRSVGFLGSKGMLEDRFPTPPAWLDPAQDPAPPPPVPPKPDKAPPPPVDCGKGGTMFAPPTPFPEKKGWTVFLAGPIGGAPEWQKSVPKLAEKEGLEGVAWLNPRGRHLPHRPQVEWETHGLRTCDYIPFWVPKQARPHRTCRLTRLRRLLPAA